MQSFSIYSLFILHRKHNYQFKQICSLGNVGLFKKYKRLNHKISFLMSISKLSSDNFPISISLPPLPQLYPFESNLFFIHMNKCQYLVQSCTREFLIKPFPCLNHHFILKIFAGPSFQNPTKNKQKNTSKKNRKKALLN